MSQNAFQSEKLQSAFQKLEGKAELLNQNIDAISGEIKTLEEQLQKLGVPVTTEVKVADNSPLKKEEDDQVRIYEESIFKALEFLKWEKDEASGKFRLIYQRLLESADIPGLSIRSIERPLIECPLAVRLKMHAHLDKLVEAISNQIDD